MGGKKVHSRPSCAAREDLRSFLRVRRIPAAVGLRGNNVVRIWAGVGPGRNRDKHIVSGVADYSSPVGRLTGGAYDWLILILFLALAIMASTSRPKLKTAWVGFGVGFVGVWGVDFFCCCVGSKSRGSSHRSTPVDPQRSLQMGHDSSPASERRRYLQT